VKPYVQQVDIRWEEVELPPAFMEVKKYIDDCFRSKLNELAAMKLIDEGRIRYMSRRDVLGLQASLQARIASGEKEFEILRGVSLAAEAMKVQHAQELLESQGIGSLYKYLSGIFEDAKTTKVKAVMNLARDINFRSALLRTEKLHEAKIEHPKIGRLKDIVAYHLEKGGDIRMIVFAQFRDSALTIVEALSKVSGAKPRIFVGQMKKAETGMSQKVQKETIDQFRAGLFNILVATQIAEEGLDIPSVDAVVFYEPTPSAIRHIQRKGRTGRLEKGEVIILMAKGTRDEAYKWSSHHKQKRMKSVLKDIKNDIHFIADEKKMGLKLYIPDDEKVTIFADYREKDSGVIKELIELGANIRLEQLKSGDFILSEDCAVELKRVEDFVNSLVDGRLLDQLKTLRANFQKPIVLIEGTEDIYNVRNVHPNAIRGLLATIVMDYSMPIIYSRNPKESAAFLNILARHEQLWEKKSISLHADRKPMTLKELQEYIVSALPGVGATLSRPMLERFGSINGVFEAGEKELKDVELIGDKKAKKIRDIIEAKYEKEG